MRGSYPDALFLSGCVVPIQKDGRWIDTTHRQVAHATTRALGVSPVHGQPIRIRAAQARSAAYEHTVVHFCRNANPGGAHPRHGARLVPYPRAPRIMRASHGHIWSDQPRKHNA